ncbi:MAG: glycosyltransferase WbuB, partial [Actinomycetota bacterium]
MSTNRSGRILVMCPHFDPDVAPTGVVMSRIVEELARTGHEIHVITALPWYARHRVEEPWNQVTWKTRTETTAWGSVVRLHPRGGADKSNLLRRALGFAAFSLASVLAGLRAAPRQRFDAVLAMSPPLTLGLAAKLVAVVRRA